jgi:ribosomal protein S18 acetylase RimI-like enzyme
MDVTLRHATLDDCDVLAAMNLELIADEGSRNPMTQLELSERMRRWLLTDWQAALFLLGKQVVGYTLYQVRQDQHQPANPEVYIRHYFVKRLLRGHGVGRSAFDQLRAEYFPAEAVIALDVLATNPDGRRFWEKLGFKSYAENLRLEMRDGE